MGSSQSQIQIVQVKPDIQKVLSEETEDFKSTYDDSQQWQPSFGQFTNQQSSQPKQIEKQEEQNHIHQETPAFETQNPDDLENQFNDYIKKINTLSQEYQDILNFRFRGSLENQSNDSFLGRQKSSKILDDEYIRLEKKIVYNKLLDLGFYSKRISKIVDGLQIDPEKTEQDYIIRAIQDIDQQNQNQTLLQLSVEGNSRHSSTNNSGLSHSRRNEIYSDKSEEFEQSLQCKICCLNYDDNSMFVISNCAHFFCKECLCIYILGLISEIAIGNKSFVKCPEVSCNNLIPHRQIAQLIQLEDYKRLLNVLLTSELNSNQFAKWCHDDHCTGYCLKKYQESLYSECNICKKLTCMNCGRKWHEGINCEGNIDNEYFAKIGIINVTCPKCNFGFFKLAGCNHLQCHNCKFQFCQICRQQYQEGHYKLEGKCMGKQFTKLSSAQGNNIYQPFFSSYPSKAVKQLIGEDDSEELNCCLCFGSNKSKNLQRQ